MNFPFFDHPLTRLYLMAVNAKSQPDLKMAMDIVRALEKGADQRTIDACKLAAEVALERKT